MTMAKKLPLLAPFLHTFEVNGTYTDCEAKRTVFMAIQKMVSAGKYYRIPYHGSSKKGYSYSWMDWSGWSFSDHRLCFSADRYHTFCCKRSWHPQYPSPVQRPGWQIHDGCGLPPLPSSFLPAKADGLCHAPGRILFCRHHPGSRSRSLRRSEAPKGPTLLRHRLQHLSPRPQRTPAAARSLRNPARCFCGQMR